MSELELKLLHVGLKEAGIFFIKLEITSNTENASVSNDSPPIKFRTDVSQESNNPIFEKNTFKLELPSDYTRRVYDVTLYLCLIKKEADESVNVFEHGVSKISLTSQLKKLTGTPSAETCLNEKFVNNNNNEVGEFQIAITITNKHEKNVNDTTSVARKNSNEHVDTKPDIEREPSAGYDRILLKRSLANISLEDSVRDNDSEISVQDQPNVDLIDDRVSVASEGNILLNKMEIEKKISNPPSEIKEIYSTTEKVKVCVTELESEERIFNEKYHGHKYFQRFLAQDGTHHEGQKIIIQIHDVWDLPFFKNATTGKPSLPCAFVSLKTTRDDIEKKKAISATHVYLPSREASFGEFLVISFPQPYSQSNIPSILLSILDNSTKRTIAKFTLPISNTYFPSHRQLSLLLRSVSTSPEFSSPQMRVTITNIDTHISSPYILQREYEGKMIFLEMMVRELEKFPFEMRIVCVVKVVDDGTQYLSKLKTLQRRFEEGYPLSLPPIQPQVCLDFDSSGKCINDDAWSGVYVDGLIYNRGRKVRDINGEYYQMTVASEMGDKPSWDQYFMFILDMMNLSAETSLIIEYYLDKPALKTSDPFNSENPPADYQGDTGRPLDELVGYSYVPLGDFTVLGVSDSNQIKRLEKLKVEFVGKYKQVPGTGSVYMKMDIKVPDNWHLLNPKSNPTPNPEFKDLVPNIDKIGKDIETTVNGQFPTRILHRKKNDPLPDMDFDSLIAKVKAERVEEEAIKKKQKISMESALDPTKMVFTFHDIEQRQKLIDRLMVELEARSVAVKKIGADLYSLRELNESLENKIKLLEKNVSENEVKTVKLLNTVDIDIIPHDELKRRYALMAEKLQLEINKTKDLSDRLEVSQEGAIERNELEKKYLSLRQAHIAQAAYIQKLQDAIHESSKYKNAIKKQEQVIQKLEILLKDSMKGSNKEKLEEFFENARLDPNTFDGGVYRLLTEENQMLKDKLLQLERLTTPNQKRKDEENSNAMADLKYELEIEKEKTKKMSKELLKTFSSSSTLQDDCDEGAKASINNSNNDIEMFKLLLRAEKAEARVQSLEAELTNAAKQFAKKSTDMKIKLSGILANESNDFTSRGNSPVGLNNNTRVSPIPNSRHHSRKPSYFLNPLQ